MRRYYDHRLKKDIINIDIGEQAITGENVFIGTVLGSCVSAVVFDTEAHIGGMNHFQMPEPLSTSDIEERAGFYGCNAMPRLLKAMDEADCSRENLRAKIFGGACRFFCEDEPSLSSIGLRNVDYAQSFLEDAGIPIDRIGAGGSYGRRLYFDVKTFVVYVRRLSEGLGAVPSY